MQNNVLIPSDFSSTALNAIEYAFELFKDQACDFHIFHAYYIVSSTKGNPLFPVPDEVEYIKARNLISAEMEMLKQNVKALQHNENHKVHFDFQYGFLVDQVKKKVLQNDIDLIIMGTRGVTDDKKVAYGRNAVDVMEKVRLCPVLAIPRTVKFQQPGEIVFPTDFKSTVDVDEIDSFKRIAQISNSSIRIFHIGREASLSPKQKEGKQELEKHLESLEYSFHWLQNVGLMEGLLLFVKQRESSMICFVNRKHWFFGNIFSNPLIKNLGVHATVPLLALHGDSN